MSLVTGPPEHSESICVAENVCCSHQQLVIKLGLLLAMHSIMSLSHSAAQATVQLAKERRGKEGREGRERTIAIRAEGMRGEKTEHLFWD